MSEVNLVLEKFLHVMPLLGAMFSADIGVAVTDREKYLLYSQADSWTCASPPARRSNKARPSYGR